MTKAERAREAKRLHEGLAMAANFAGYARDRAHEGRYAAARTDMGVAMRNLKNIEPLADALADCENAERSEKRKRDIERAVGKLERMAELDLTAAQARAIAEEIVG